MVQEPTLQEFLLNKNWLALRLSPSRQGHGGWSGRFTIPLNSAALTLHPDGTMGFTPEGHETAARSELILAKSGEVELKMIFPDLRTADNYPMNATCAFMLSIHTNRLDLFKDLARTAMTTQSLYTTSDLKSSLAQELKHILGDFVARFPASELNRKGRVADFEETFGIRMERHVFGTGLKFERLIDISFASHEFEQALLQHEQEITRAREEQSRIQHRKEMTHQLKEILRSASPHQLLARISTPQLRRDLYLKLLENECGPSEFADRLTSLGDDFLSSLLNCLKNTPSPILQFPPLSIDTASRIFLAAGSKAIELDGKRPEQGHEEHLFPTPIRSVRVCDSPHGPLLLAGGKNAIHARPLQSPDAGIQTYPLPKGRDPKGGINSVALLDGQLFATHSEYGLANWSLDQPDREAKILFEELTSPHRTTRAVQAIHGVLYFSTGPEVYGLNLRTGAPSPLRFQTHSEGAITSLLALDHTLFAGTSQGVILSWNTAKPEEPQIIAQKRDPMTALRVTSILGIPHLMYSTQGTRIRARVLGQDLETVYETGGPPVSFMDCTSDKVCAADPAGSRLWIWQANRPQAPLLTLDCWAFAQKPILDVWIQRQKG